MECPRPGRQCTLVVPLSGKMCLGDLWEPLSVTCLRPSVHILPGENRGPAPHFSRVKGMIWRWLRFSIRGKGIVPGLLSPCLAYTIGASEIAILYFAQMRSVQEKQVIFGRRGQVEGLEVEKCSWLWRGPGARPERVSPRQWGAGSALRLRW